LLWHIVADGDGTVNALRKALLHFYPEIKSIKLVDYNVRVLEEKRGTSDQRAGTDRSQATVAQPGFTVGVSTNIIEASLHALEDSMNYHLFTLKAAVPPVIETPQA
jgi:2-isopropylmalate synthase